MIQTQERIERLRTLQEQLDSALHETAQETTLLAESAAIKQAIADKPEVDLSEVAKESTLTEIKGILSEIKTATEAIGVISDEQIDALFE